MADQQNDHDLLIRIDTRLQDLILDNSAFKKEIAKLEEKKIDKEEINQKLTKQDIIDQDRFKDIEIRLRRLERAYYIGITIIAILEIFLKSN